MVLSECGKPAEQKSGKTETPKKEELMLAIGSDPAKGWDPLKGWGSYGSSLFQSKLLKRDAKLQLQNDLAEEYKVSEDRKVWAVKIRKDTKFSDVKPLTAKDVAFTYNTGKAEKGAVAGKLATMKEAKIIDDHTLEFHLTQPDITFVYKNLF